MYCPACGLAVAQNLSYCNHCGASLSRDRAGKSSEVKTVVLVPAMAFLFIFGLLAIGMLTRMMKVELGFNEGQVFALTILSFLMLLGLEGVFVSLLFRRPRHNDEVQTTALKRRATKELDATRTPALPDVAPSVTEHTTRTLNPVYTERK